MFWRKDRYKKHRRKSLWRRLMSIGPWVRWGITALFIFLIVDSYYLSTVWPDWKKLSVGATPRSSFINRYQSLHHRKKWPRLQWKPVTIDEMPKHMQRAVVVAEDSRFYWHEGFDLTAFKEAMDYNVTERRFAFGASTISQQTVKNLFLSPSKNPLRKWHELIMTWGMEKNLTKKRILELYLNIVEFDRGVYGVEAAARHYWGIPARQLSIKQSAELAATLPSPIKNNPRTRTKAFERRVEKILKWVEPNTDRFAY